MSDFPCMEDVIPSASRNGNILYSVESFCAISKHCIKAIVPRWKECLTPFFSANSPRGDNDTSFSIIFISPKVVSWERRPLKMSFSPWSAYLLGVESKSFSTLNPKIRASRFLYNLPLCCNVRSMTLSSFDKSCVM